MRRRPSDWRVIETTRETAPSTRTRPADEIRIADASEKEGAAKNGPAQTKSGATQTRTQGTTKVTSVSNDGRAPMVFGRRATYFDNPRLALFAPPRWPGGGGGRSARRSAKS
jgi:hypothetical protein